jgi:hypothetical protein
MSHGDRPGPEAAETSRSADSALQFATESGDASFAGSSEPSRVGYSTQSTGNLGSTQDSDPAPEDGHIRVLRKLEEATESFRGGKTSKTDAVSSILNILQENTDVSLSQSQREATFDPYLTEILSIQSTFDESRGPETTGTRPNHDHSSSDPSNLAPAVRRSRDPQDSESDDDDEKPVKKQRLLESDMPWYTESGETSLSYSNPSCKKTCGLLRAYNQDISKAKFFIKVTPDSPSGIPSSQWECILKGEAVDLNQIFTSLHHVVPEEERTSRLGDTEISFGVAEARKRVLTASDWSTAWRRASKAISFAFPHRRDELLEYEDYIELEFAAKVASSHHKILLYDVALRNEVGVGQHVLLTDHNWFS